MRAVVMQDHALRVDTIADLEPRPGEVLVDVLACGICGSDLHCAQHPEELNAAGMATMGAEFMDLSKPVVFGHEFVGRIAGHGRKGDDSLPVGQRVVSVPLLPRDPPAFIGYCGTEVPGGYAEQLLLAEATLLPVPDEVPTEVAALTEPLAVGYRAVVRAGLGSDDVPLVVGCGPIGLAVIAVLRMKGCGPIVAADPVAERRKMAEQLGADILVDPSESSPYEAWQRAAATDDEQRMLAPTALIGQLPIRPTVAFECVGAPGLIQQLVVGSPAASRIVVAGICMTTDTFEPAQAVIKELDVRFAMMYGLEEFATTFGHVRAGELDATAMITNTVDLDGVPSAFEELSSSPRHAKVLIRPNPD